MNALSKVKKLILKSAIYEEPFKPQMRGVSELVRGFSPGEYPTLLGYVATTPKPRAETPLWTDKGNPLLAHWHYGLGRAVAFTSDAKARWARNWLGWDQYRQFWSQIGQWSMRRLGNADFTTEVTVDKGEGLINVEALDPQGNFRNFLNLQTIVLSPTGKRQTVRLEQKGPGHYEARFATGEVGAYLLNLMDMKDGQVRGKPLAPLPAAPDKRCTAPCVRFITPEAYARDVDAAAQLLKGEATALTETITEQMNAAAAALDFETAALLRDRLRMLATVREKQFVDTTGSEVAPDVVAVAEAGGVIAVNLTMIRGGRHLGDRSFFPQHGEGATPAEALDAFIAQHYLDHPIPARILVSEAIETDALEALLTEQAGKKIAIQHRVTGERRVEYWRSELPGSCICSGNHPPPP